MANQKEPRIFLCHASDDKERVRELYRQLKEAGYHPWLDEEDLLPGQKWWPAIRKVISDPYNLVVVCLSCNSVTRRGVVQQEIKRALDVLDRMPEDAIYLIPARLEDCPVPERLADLHWVDLFRPRGFERLRRALDFELGKRQPSPAPATRTPAPQAVKPGPAAPPPVAGWPEVARVVNQAGQSLRPRPGEKLLRTGDIQRAIERLGGYGKGSVEPDHPDTATSLNNLGLLLYAMGDLVAARPHYERALDILEARLGPSHPTTRIVRRNLAALDKTE